MTSEPIHVAYIPDQLRFEYLPQKTMTLDIISTELMMESFIKDEPTTEIMLGRIKEWAKENYEAELTETTAWTLWQIVRGAYESHKKKLLLSLSSALVTASTPTTFLQKNSLDLNEKSQESKPSKKSKKETVEVT